MATQIPTADSEVRKSTIFEVLATLKLRVPTVIVEIGAADGKDSETLIDLLDPDEYYAFEPDARNILLLKNSDVAKLNYFNLVPCAVGNRNRRVDFYASHGFNENLKCDHTFSGSVKEPVEHLKEHPWCKFEYVKNVPMVRLDDFAQLFSIPPISLIWCDVQGAEDLVIEGAQNALRGCSYFYTEYYRNEMYRGQIDDKEIQRRLPGKWQVAGRWVDNVLFKNVS